MRKFAIFLIRFYQKYISKFTPSSCRFYPTCSEYAIWQIKYNNLFTAFLATAFRILRCNQLFKGGIDYPVIHKRFDSLLVFNQNFDTNVLFWFIPFKDNKFYVVKKIDFKKEKEC